MENNILGYHLYAQGEYINNESELIIFGVFDKENNCPLAVGKIEFNYYEGAPEDYDGEYNAIFFTSDFFRFSDSVLKLFTEFAKTSNGKMINKEQVIECLQRCGYVEIQHYESPF